MVTFTGLHAGSHSHLVFLGCSGVIKADHKMAHGQAPWSHGLEILPQESLRSSCAMLGSEIYVIRTSPDSSIPGAKQYFVSIFPPAPLARVQKNQIG